MRRAVAVSLAGWASIMSLGWWLASERMARCSSTYNCVVHEMGTRDAFLIAGLLVPFVFVAGGRLLTAFRGRRLSHAAQPRYDVAGSKPPLFVEGFNPTGAPLNPRALDRLARARTAGAFGSALIIIGISAWLGNGFWFGAFDLIVGLGATAVLLGLAILMTVSPVLGWWSAKRTGREWAGWAVCVSVAVGVVLLSMWLYAPLMRGICRDTHSRAALHDCLADYGVDDGDPVAPGTGVKLTPVSGNPFERSSPGGRQLDRGGLSPAS